MATTTGQNLPLHSRPRPSEILIILAPFLWGPLVTFVLLPSPEELPSPGLFWSAVVVQSVFALALLAVALSGRLSWNSLGLHREGLGASLALGLLLSLLVVLLTEVLPYLLGQGTPLFQIVAFGATRYLGVPLAFALYLLFWGIFESVWMCYLIYAANRWLTGGGDLRWRALFLASLLFGLLHVQGQLVFDGASLPQALGSVVIGLALLIPGIIPKLTGNAWGLVLWFTVTNF